MRKRFLSALLALCMALTLFPATALAGDFGEKRLEGGDLEMYRELRTFIAKIASGEETSTVLEINGTFASGDTAQNVMKRAGKVVDYLMVDCPAELYWYDKTTGSAQNISSISNQYTLTVTFYVSEDYSLKDASGNSLNTQIDSAKVTPAKTALTYAQTIVDTYKDVSDFAKLEGYKKEICDLVSYNNDAAKDNTTPYGDPWQLIYVFDKNPNTNVVCEGYSKAFQYLCDLTTFENSIVCYTVTGTMSGGTGAGGHMWNIVQIGGKNYLVDVTNSDEGSVGQDGELFMAGKAAEADGSYKFAVGSQTITFTYDEADENGKLSQMDFYGPEILTLDTQNYTPPAQTEPVDWDFAITNTVLTVEEDATLQMTASDSPVTWSVTNGTGKAEISDSGLLTAKKEGTVTVTATKAADETHNETPKHVTVTITKKADEPTPPAPSEPVDWDFSITNTVLTVEEDATLQMTASDSPVTWSVANGTGKAEISDSGLLTAKKEGTVTVTATKAADETHNETPKHVTVTITKKADEPTPPAPSEPVDWDFSITNTVLTVDEGDTLQMTASNRVVWDVENGTGKATIDANGLLTAVKEGNVSVIATMEEDADHKETSIRATVTITKKPDEPTPPPVTPAEPVEPEVSVREITVVSGTRVTDDFIKGTANVPGTWAFVGTVPETIGNHDVTVRFSPDDTTKYKAVDRTIKLYIVKQIAPITVDTIRGITIDKPAYDVNAFNPRTGNNDGCWEQNVTVNVNITLTGLFKQMFNNTNWSGDVYYFDANKSARSMGGYAFVGYWDAETGTFRDGKGGPVMAEPEVWRGTYLIDPSNGSEPLALVVSVPADDSETYYISIPGVTGGEIIPSTRYAAYGERVTLSVHPASGYELSGLTVRDIRGRALTLREVSGTARTFTMPSSRVTVEAEFVKKDAETDAPSRDEIPGTSHTASDPNEEPFTGLGTPGISGIVLNPASMPFSDVKASDWYYNYVEYMWKHYLMSGTSDTRFEPNLTTSRAMIWTIMARMNNIRTDINPGSTWYERGMLWAMEQGVTDGTNPMGDITREQLVTMLWRNAGKPGASVGTLSQFSDAASVSGYAETAVRWAVGAGILTGDNGRINPQGTAARAQVAAMIARYGDKAAGR